MKKVFMGVSALGVAIAAVAFTTPKKASTDYFFQQTTGGSFVSQPYITNSTPTTVDLGCAGGPLKCEGEFSGYITNITGGVKTSWSPVLVDEIALIGKHS